MDIQSTVDHANTLSDQALIEVLFHALFILSYRGAATAEQLRIMVELQYLEAPQLRVA